MLEIFFNNFQHFSEKFFQKLSGAKSTERLYFDFFKSEDGLFNLNFRKRGTECKVSGKILENAVLIEEFNTFYADVFLELMINLFKEEIKLFVSNVIFNQKILNDLENKEIIAKDAKIDGKNVLSVYLIYKHYESLKSGLIYKTQCPKIEFDDKLEYED